MNRADIAWRMPPHCSHAACLAPALRVVYTFTCRHAAMSAGIRRIPLQERVCREPCDATLVSVLHNTSALAAAQPEHGVGRMHGYGRIAPYLYHIGQNRRSIRLKASGASPIREPYTTAAASRFRARCIRIYSASASNARRAVRCCI
jgi:hypothetical protein